MEFVFVSLLFLNKKMYSYKSFSILYKLLSRLLIFCTFREKSNRYLAKNYILPISYLSNYYFLYPCYLEAAKEGLKSKNIKTNCLSKSKALFKDNEQVNFKKNNTKFNSIYIIGSEEKTTETLFIKAIKVLQEKKINTIYFREHPRIKYKVDFKRKFGKKNQIKFDNNDLISIKKNSLIFISYSSLLPYFLRSNYKIFLCKDSLKYELKTKEKVEAFIEIYSSIYKNQVQFI